ncbi:33 kDa chaperonin [Vibrio ishigakensis]|uniref:33 kDa chaperonin n=1 Tax=Vibrio ishigakensis TaxID=1481914 RepID=A0A0B8QJQ4_9VIBR|nr:33 kDa chaperonin [Vibrio sp. JCM 19236]GAM77307.1 33 kDa chaperonin [Vibrio ishigakensis]
MENNVLNRYLFEDLSVRGELVQLDKAYQSIIQASNTRCLCKLCLVNCLLLPHY